MLKHIVFFKMLDEALGATGEENAKALKVKFDDLIDKIPQLKKVETGLNVNVEEYDLCLYSEFDGADALKQYLEHPAHQEVRDFVFKVIDHRVVVDYEV